MTMENLESDMYPEDSTQTPGLSKGNAITMNPPVTFELGSEAGIVTTSRRGGLTKLAEARTFSSKTPLPCARRRKS
jgi:hypothetical protein